MNKYCLIIQGPIRSKGLTPKVFDVWNLNRLKRFNEPNNLGNNHLNAQTVDFNCLENIENLLNDFGHLFEKIVISTWVDEEICENDVSHHKNCVLLKNPTENIIVGKSKVNTTGKINLFKQFYSLEKGIEALGSEGLDCTVVKIRTDQYIDLELLISEHQKFTEAEKNTKLIAPYISLDNEIGDFYFAGQGALLLEFCKSIRELYSNYKFEMGSRSVHAIMMVAFYLKRKPGELKSIKKFIYLKSLGPSLIRFKKKIKNCELAYDILKFIEHQFAFFSANLLSTLIWRGERVESIPPLFKFKIDLDAFDSVLPRLKTSNLFLYLAARPYFSGRGGKTFQSIFGIFFFTIITVFPFYRNRILKKYIISE